MSKAGAMAGHLGPNAAATWAFLLASTISSARRKQAERQEKHPHQDSTKWPTHPSTGQIIAVTPPTEGTPTLNTIT
jgi:hypothetical protein